MSKNIFLKIITLILIISTFTLPFFEVARVSAQVNGSFSTSGSFESGGISGIGGYIELITPAIQELPLCKEAIANSKIKGLFRNSDFVLKQDGELKELENSLQQPDSFSQSQAIPVYDEAQLKEEKKQTANTEETKKTVKNIEENDTCLKSIGRIVVKLLLQKITFSTVEWINNGAEGKPLFLSDPGDFFYDIARNELLIFRTNISDPSIYPFGRSFLRQQVNSLNNRFAINARYSANELIQKTTPNYSSTKFFGDFQSGGWNAWNAITQVPANNPIGFNVIATNEISVKLEGTSSNEAQRKQQDIAQSEGFLGVERCVADPEITRAEHRRALEDGKQEMEKYEVIVGSDDDGGLDTYTTKTRPTGNIIGACPGNRWEYVTPGKAVSESLTKVLNYPDNNILKADDLNTAIATILDAAMNKFIPDLLNKGLAGISTEGRDGAFIYNDSGRTSGSYTQVSLDFPASSVRSSWLRENSDFNIRTDLTQAVIDEQRIYQERLKTQNEILKDLIATVYQLDYCIPGPHPGFEEDSRNTLAAVINTIPSKTAANFPEDVTVEQITQLVKAAGYIAGAAIGASIGTAVLPVVGTAIGAAIGALIGAVVDLLSGPDEYEKLDLYYALIFRSHTGIPLSKPNTVWAGISGKQDITNAMESMLDRYIKLIKKHYTPEFLPTVTPSAKKEFRRVPGYYQQIDNNEYAINSLENIIIRLADLKDTLEKLDPETNSYSDYLPHITEFARISGSMITGNDIAKAIDENKEYVAKMKYVYEDLLTGPYGCEKDLELKRQPSPGKTTMLRETKRAEYPFQIWYEYTPNEEIPPVADFKEKYNILAPEEKCPQEKDGVCKGTNRSPANKVPDWDTRSLGPGFLSSVVFDHSMPEKKPLGCPQMLVVREPRALDCLQVSDLFFHVPEEKKTVGRKQDTSKVGDTLGQENMSFEQTIGIY